MLSREPRQGSCGGLSAAPLAPDPPAREAPLLRASAADERHLGLLDPVLIRRPGHADAEGLHGRPPPGVLGTGSPRRQPWLRPQVACFFTMVASAKERRRWLIGAQRRPRRDVDMPGLAGVCLKERLDQQATRVLRLFAPHTGYLCTGTPTAVRSHGTFLLRPSGRSIRGYNLQRHPPWISRSLARSTA